MPTYRLLLELHHFQLRMAREDAVAKLCPLRRAARPAKINQEHILGRVVANHTGEDPHCNVGFSARS